MPVCTKIYLPNSKVCKFIQNKLIINVVDFYPVHLSCNVMTNELVNLFVHSYVCDRQE